MYEINKKKDMSFGQIKETGIMTDQEGRHFCYRCRKLIRIDQEYQVHSEPKALRREIGYYYRHFPDCN